MPNTDNPRSFSFADPVLYNGAYYPSVEDTIEQNGTVRKGRVFADANGQYFTLDNQGNAVPAMVQNVLPEVTVTPSQQEMLADAFSRHLTMSNDKTQVANTPHRPYNTHLSDNALRGAKYHAQWEREHPNLSSWSYATAALPFAVAAAPLAMGAGQAVAGTALGQTALNSANAIMSTPLMEMVNAATGLGFAAKGGYDISQGKFTPETALELMPIISEGKHLVTNIRDYHNLNNFINRYGYAEYNPSMGLIFNDVKLDKLTNQLVRQHNTFTRGISINEARKYYNFPKDWTDEQVAEYTLTHPHKPTVGNSGGNPNQRPVLYTSNSLDLSKTYTDNDGYVGILQRPLTYSSNRSEMLKLNDFRFNRDTNNPMSATTDEPYILTRYKNSKPKYQRIKGGVAFKQKGKIISEYTPVESTFLDAQANAGSEIMSVRKPDDLDFRHYLWYGESNNPLLELKGLFKYIKPKDSPSVDYAKHSVGFSKKKALGGKL